MRRPSALPRLEGTEPLADGRVVDFWRWALGDLRMNNARGYLAEYLVAHAVGDRSERRIEWGARDVEAPDGTRIEVKATGRLQSWTSARPTPPEWKFSNIATRAQSWSEDVGRWVDVDPWDRVDVWVFALQACEDPDRYDPLDLTQWEFRVLPHRTLLAAGQKSARQSTIDRLGGQARPAEQLRTEVAAAAAKNRAISRPVPDREYRGGHG